MRPHCLSLPAAVHVPQPLHVTPPGQHPRLHRAKAVVTAVVWGATVAANLFCALEQCGKASVETDAPNDCALCMRIMKTRAPTCAGQPWQAPQGKRRGSGGGVEGKDRLRGGGEDMRVGLGSVAGVQPPRWSRQARHTNVHNHTPPCSHVHPHQRTYTHQLLKHHHHHHHHSSSN